LFTAANKCIKALVKDEAENEDLEGNRWEASVVDAEWA